ncbi:ABC transporter substrate-binding protein [Paenibacillus gansuensis]|uniref:ABC transporter substrate-binding protein n=1 Tax=Paenibacillus gansuensis TaxID=306542 RepID=A0ABW5PIB0_9BACL
MRNKQMRQFMAMAMTMVVSLTILSACSGGNNTNNASNADGEQGKTGTNQTVNSQNQTNEANKPADPMAPYAETVSFTTVRAIDQNPKFPDANVSWEKNPVQDYIEKALNIKGDLLWTAPSDGEQYTKKLALDIASNQLPDIFYITGSNSLALLNQLVKGDMIEPMGQWLDQYGSDKVKGYYQSNPNAFQNVMYGGKMMALPGAGSVSNPMLVWVREDWRKKLNLPEPTTIETLRENALAFTKNDPDGNKKNDTIGLAVQKDAYMAQAFDLHTFDAITWSKRAFPMSWIKGPDGKVTYGGIQPEAKNVLAILRDMYQDGSLDPAFGQKDGGKTTEDAGAGKVGMVFQAWYAPYYPLGNTLRNDPTAEWKPYALLSDDGKLVHTNNPADTSFLVVRKGFKHPELAVKLMNLNTEIGEFMVPELQDWYDATTKAGTNFSGTYPQYINFGVGNPTDIPDKIRLYKDIAAGKADPATLDGKKTGDWNAIKYELDNPWEATLKKWDSMSKEDQETALNNHIGYVAWMEGAATSWGTHPEETHPNLFTGQTETMKTRWENLKTLQTQAYFEMILGKESIDLTFDKFVSDWKSQGGDQITQEVQAEIDKR